ncbi:MAG TPA: hypothetical protein VJ529_01990 [Candidatus Bathyarchaeia archaeon]|nr:hypothetical protein [Candidatus Bathyarchaeia archaeon]
MSEVQGYVLRIKDEKWVEQVFDMAIYYSNLNRRWSPGQTVLFVHKTRLGDAFVGYGIVSHAKQKRYLPDEERVQCEQGGWRKAIEFKYVVRFEKPLLVKETLFSNSKLRGRYFHGLKLNREQVEVVVRKAEELQTNQKS